MHNIKVEVLSFSKAKFLFKRLGSFIEGEPFLVSCRYTNIGDYVFPGGKASLIVEWPNGQKVIFSEIVLPKLEPNSSYLKELGETDALSEGFALFSCAIYPNDNQPAKIFDAGGNERPPPYSIGSIRVKTWEELYTYWALLLSAGSLGIIAIEKIWATLSVIVDLVKSFLQDC